jgi:putative metallohydrolase (TIGR04338 family)
LGKRLNIHPDVQRPRERYFAPDSKRWWRKGERPRRDSYRQRCCDAEERFACKVEQRTFSNITEAAKYIRTVMEKPWFQRRFPCFTEVEVRYEPRTSISRGGPRQMFPGRTEVMTGMIRLSSWGMGQKGGRGGEVVLLHELAHAVLPRGHKHDRRWARTFLEFVGCMMGQPARKILMEEYRKEGVPFSPFKQVDFTEEQLERLAAARPKREGK